MTWFVGQVFRTSNTFDYAAERLVSEPLTMRGYFDRTEDGDPTFEERRAEGRYRTTVVMPNLDRNRKPGTYAVSARKREREVSDDTATGGRSQSRTR